ncbi:MAG: type II toxin-antitoxin system RelE/ParE family toxin [Candidatus Melainabacteria bacterium]|nr:type II toxin-antitoxin system RelE/ParE family toxin [Candidatus Melainabacteria bacterium]
MNANESIVAIKTFKHKGLKKFFDSGSKTSIQAAHAKKIALILDRLDAATESKDMNFPGSDFHPLKGEFKGFYSVHVNGNWTIIFRLENGEANDVDLIDYH